MSVNGVEGAREVEECDAHNAACLLQVGISPVPQVDGRAVLEKSAINWPILNRHMSNAHTQTESNNRVTEADIRYVTKV